MITCPKLVPSKDKDFTAETKTTFHVCSSLNVDEISGVGFRVDVNIVVGDRVDVGKVVVVVCLVQAQTRRMSNDLQRQNCQ